jgi:polar amino acid transport system substrate-binding protein
MAFGEKTPPFCFPKSDSGIDLEMISAGSAFRGHHREPRYLPLARVPLAFRKGKVAAAMTDLGQALAKAGGNWGNPEVIYSNVFVSLISRHPEIKQPEGLNSLSIMAVEGAVQRDPEWLATSKAEGLYCESTTRSCRCLA